MMATAVAAAESRADVAGAGAFRVGWVFSRRADIVWFLSLPMAAVMIALGAQAWLSFAAVASVNLWITVPHHYATWVRSYAMPDTFERFKGRLLLGPALIIAFAAAGLTWAPITLTLVVLAWDHQHSIMQQHGFARIYDFKAKAGLPSTGRMDLALHCLLYGNMAVNAPMFRHLWIRELYQMDIPVSVAAVETLTRGVWFALGIYLVIYAVHLVRTVRAGHQLNPMKYAFLAASYFLWYFTAWHTNSILLYGIAHRIMHGVQYIVMVYFFLDRTKKQGEARPGLWSRLSGEGHLVWFLLAGGIYALFFQFLLGSPLDEFGFGVVNFANYQAIPTFDIPNLGFAGGYELFSLTVLNVYGMTHYYVDSFIWKVRDRRVQRGL